MTNSIILSRPRRPPNLFINDLLVITQNILSLIPTWLGYCFNRIISAWRWSDHGPLDLTLPKLCGFALPKGARRGLLLGDGDSGDQVTVGLLGLLKVPYFYVLLDVTSLGKIQFLRKEKSLTFLKFLCEMPHTQGFFDIPFYPSSLLML